MTAKHRGKGKNNHKNEENSFRHEVLESEARGGGYHYTLLFLLFLLVLMGGAAATWFSFQQHLTITSLADSLMAMQMKMVKLQSFQEEIRQSSNKQSSEGLELRLNALEESYTMVQRQVGTAMATAEQLKTSDLPAQVLSLHTEMKARLSELQQATVSMEQLNQLQDLLMEKGEELQAVRLDVENLSGMNDEVALSVEALTGSLASTEAKLDERAGLVDSLNSGLDIQASELFELKKQLASHQAQMEASTLEITNLRELLEVQHSHWVQLAGEQLSKVGPSMQEESSAAQRLLTRLGSHLENVQNLVAQPAPVADTEEAQPEQHAAEEDVLLLDGLPADLETLVAEEQSVPEKEMMEVIEMEEDVADKEESVPAEPEEEESVPAEPEEEESVPAEPEEEESVPAEPEEEESVPAEPEEEESVPAEPEEEESVPEEEEVQEEGELKEDVEEGESAPVEEEKVGEEHIVPVKEEDMADPTPEEVLEEEPIGEENLDLDEEEGFEGGEELEDIFEEEE